VSPLGRISDIIPPIYYDRQNDLIRYTDCLDVEVKELERQIRGITDLINVDKCPEEKLPYLAAITNCPLMGNDPALWRRQIKNWPYLLKIKGTALSLELFLDSIDVDEHKIYTFFRDAQGNLVEEKPEGAPFQDSTGLWHNVRTHYFDLDIIYEDEHYLTWTEWHQDFLRSMNIWLTRAKPFHSELRTLKVILERKEELHLFVGTAISQGVQHELPFVPETHSTDAQSIIVGGAIGQIQRHDIPIAHGSHGETGFDITAGTAIAQGKFHTLSFVPETHSSDNQPLTAGAAIGQKISSTVHIEQATSSEEVSALGSGTAIVQGIHYDIGIEQSSKANFDALLYAGCLLACNVHIQLKMAA
jgi:hypothetical protein